MAVVVVGAVVVVTLPGSGPRPGPGAAAAGASYADPSDVPRLSETTLPFLAFPFFVPRLREFGPEAVRGQAPVATVVAVPAAGAAARTSPRSPGPRAPRPNATVRARSLRQRHTDQLMQTEMKIKNGI